MTPFLFEGDYSHAALVERAVRNASPHGLDSAARWVCIKETFGWGSTTSIHLCVEFGLDPYEELEGHVCPACEPP